MTDEQLTAELRRMRTVADAYLADARSLEEMPTTQSDGAYLLQLTAFEILLKGLLRANGLVAEKSHGYCGLFNDLPCALQLTILGLAARRLGPAGDFANLPGLLRTWGSNFVKLRYSYEAYDGMSDDQVRQLSKQWIAGGAETDQATFRLYPLELAALTEAVQQELAKSGGDDGGPSSTMPD